MTYQNPQAHYTTTLQLRRIHASCPEPRRVDGYTPQEARALEDHYISEMKKPQKRFSMNSLVHRKPTFPVKMNIPLE